METLDTQRERLERLTQLAVAILLEDQRARHRKAATAPKVAAIVTFALTTSHECPHIDAVAPQLAMSDATLRRTLYLENTSYQGILDQVRLELACQLLAKDMLIDDVAWDLGFSAPSGFSRAFKLWTGQSPTQWRAECIAELQLAPPQIPDTDSTQNSGLLATPANRVDRRLPLHRLGASTR